MTEFLKIFAGYGQNTNVPVFYIHSVGFYSSFSVQLPHDFPIVDTHPDPISTTDLRLLRPWPALLEYAGRKTKDIKWMDDEQHGHVPYLLLMLYYLDEWKKSHGGRLPSNFKEKNEFKKLLQDEMRLDNPTAGEENYEQAIAAVIKNLNEPLPSSAVKEVFNAEECQNLSTMSANFWIIAHAISQFYKRYGVLPLPGSVPDMKAQSSDYIELQNVYKSKAREDVTEVLSIVRSLEMGLYRTHPIDEKEVEAFCKTAQHAKLIRGRPIQIVGSYGRVAWGNRAKHLSE
jgi:NEDD8-activating enzyme E1 regulatory subunit